MAFFRPQQDFDKPQLGEEYYHAIVIDNNDPDRLKRIKIRIEELHGTSSEIPDSELPWAIQFRPTFLGGDVNLSTSSVPRIGSSVIVTHIRGEIYQPAYMFELSHNSNRMSQGEEDYPDSYVLRDNDDNYWHVNLVQDKLDIKFNGDEVVEITANRDTTIGADETNNTTGNRTETIGGNINQTVTGDKTVGSTNLTINTSANVTIAAGGNITGTGANITWNGGSPVVTTNDIDPFTGLPHPEGSPTVTAQ